MKVVFVCLGNICRSPMAEAVFRQMVKDKGLEQQVIIDSAATSSWEHGNPVHHGTRERLKKEGRLLYERWWLDENFRYGKACFEPYNMTIEEFEAGILKCKVEYNRHLSIWKRLFDGAANFKHALVFLAVNYINRKEVYNKKGIKL